MTELPDDVVNTGFEGAWGAFVPRVSRETRAVQDGEEGGSVDDDQVVAAGAPPSQCDESAGDFCRVDGGGFETVEVAETADDRLAKGRARFAVSGAIGEGARLG